MDFIERENEFILRADIPGVHKVGGQGGGGGASAGSCTSRGQTWEPVGSPGAPPYPRRPSCWLCLAQLPNRHAWAARRARSG